jgi:hypothetical protein
MASTALGDLASTLKHFLQTRPDTCTYFPQSNDSYTGTSELVQPFAFRGSSHRRKHKFDMVWLYCSPICKAVRNVYPKHEDFDTKECRADFYSTLFEIESNTATFSGQYKFFKITLAPSYFVLTVFSLHFS